MPAYHSNFNQYEAMEVCGCGVYPIKTAIRGPATVMTEATPDIIDETIEYFRANVLFRNFEVKGPADRLLIYLTLFVQQCIKRVERTEKRADAQKALHTLACENFALPGDAGFPLTGTIVAPASREEQDQLRAFWKQMREETSLRMLDRLFDGETRNKWWMSFSKRKFMDRQLGS